MASKYGRSKNWIRDRIAHANAAQYNHTPQPVVVIADVTFFGRSFGVCVIRAPHLKKNLYVQEVQNESIDAYRQGRIGLEKQGYEIKAVVLDGRPGVRQLFQDVPVQMCHFHQKQIITCYLTSNPKLYLSVEHYGERKGVSSFHKFFIWYTRGLVGMKLLRDKAFRTGRADELLDVIEELIPNC